LNTQLRKTIIFIIPVLYRAGAERVFHEVVNHLDKKKYERHVICFYKDNNPYKFDPDIKFHYLFHDNPHSKSAGCGHKIKRLARGFLITFALTKILLSFPKGTIVVSFVEFTTIKALPGKLLTGLTLIARPASTGYASICYHFKNPLKRWFERFCLKADLLFADRIVVQSEGVKGDYIRHFSIPDKKLNVIPNPVDLGRIQSLKNNSYTLPVKVDKNTTIFTHVGRLVKKKNHELMIKAASLLR
jgi:glycosyltransferase involved in cell wall biosynthesis